MDKVQIHPTGFVDPTDVGGSSGEPATRPRDSTPRLDPRLLGSTRVHTSSESLYPCVCRSLCVPIAVCADRCAFRSPCVPSAK
eukprot:145477-Prymnesium_polylepis.1